MDQVLQLNEFFVEGGSQNTSHVLLHITEPSTPEEKEKGYFFAVCEINQADTPGIARFQKIIGEIENRYYEVSDTPDQTALEIILEKVNQENFSLTDGPIEFHATIGVIRQTEIIFAFAGKPEALLFYRDKEDHYQKMDLTKENQPDEEGSTESTPLFPQVIQGKIGPSDYLFVATPHIIDYFSHDRLQKIITTRPARQSAEHLGRVLRELQNSLSFGGLIIHLGKKEESTAVIKKVRPSHGSSANSLTDFFSTEQNTATTLSSSLWPVLNDKIKAVSQKLSTNEATPRPSENNRQPDYPAAEINATHVRPHQSPPTRPTPKNTQTYLLQAGRIIAKAGLYLGKFIIWLTLTLWGTLTGLVRFLIMLFFAATNYQGRRRNIMENWTREWHSRRENFRSLSLATKIMLIASLALVLVFIGSIFAIRFQQQKKLAAAAYQDSVQSIQDQINTAESNLIYKDENSAQNNIAAARETLSQLPCKTAEQKETCQNLTTSIEATVNKLNKITTVPTQKIAEWDTAGAILTGFIRIKNKFIAYSNQSASLFVYDLLTKENTVVPSNYVTTGFIGAAVPKENNFVALVSADQTVVQLNPDDATVKKVDLTLPNNTTKLDSVVIYNGRLYALDAAAKEIYRYDPIQSGFAIGRPWLKNSGSTLEGATDITIDGDIFALKANGQIIKLTAGVPAPFTLQALEPVLGENARIWTYTDLIYLYVLDSTNKRLVIFEKTGTLKAQIPLGNFTAPTDIFVDEANKIGYILDQGSLSSITLPL